MENITFTLNGELLQVPCDTTVAGLLESRGLAGKRLAVERNGDIVPRGQHERTVIQPQDRIEIVVAVGGG